MNTSHTDLAAQARPLSDSLYNELIKLLAWMLSPEPLRALSELEDLRTVGNRKIVRAQDGVSDALREKAMAVKDQIDRLRQLADALESKGEPVAVALRFPGDPRLCLSTVFDTTQEAREYAEACASKPELVQLIVATEQPVQPEKDERKPLTAEEIEQIRARWDGGVHGDRTRFIVRETEAAHGIGTEGGKHG